MNTRKSNMDIDNICHYLQHIILHFNNDHNYKKEVINYINNFNMLRLLNNEKTKIFHINLFLDNFLIFCQDLKTYKFCEYCNNKNINYDILIYLLMYINLNKKNNKNYNKKELIKISKKIKKQINIMQIGSNYTFKDKYLSNF